MDFSVRGIQRVLHTLVKNFTRDAGSDEYPGGFQIVSFSLARNKIKVKLDGSWRDQLNDGRTTHFQSKRAENYISDALPPMLA